MARGGAALFPRGIPSSHRISNCLVHIVIAMFVIGLPSAHSEIERIYVDHTDIDLLVGETYLFKLVQIGQYNTTLVVSAQIQHNDVVQLVPQTVEIPGVSEPNLTVQITHDVCAYGKGPGHSEVTFNVTPSDFVNLDTVFLRVDVMHSYTLKIISYIMGWIYFAAWSVSFYPQIYSNCKRKSVVGLNFDFISLNIMGFTMYSMFNCGLYFSKQIEDDYFIRHPRGQNPVQLNDVFFSLHAFFATIITVAQCYIFKCESQRVSTLVRGLLGVFTGVVAVSASLSAAGVITWLDFLYHCSYIKLAITLIKYVPQAYMNYERKSTEGWSIGNVFLDFTGGTLSIMQMALNAYNYNDWISLFGDVTKFGLGLFSLLFDVFFMLQHYVFYRDARYIRLPGRNPHEENIAEAEETEGVPSAETPYQAAPA